MDAAWWQWVAAVPAAVAAVAATAAVVRMVWRCFGARTEPVPPIPQTRRPHRCIVLLVHDQADQIEGFLRTLAWMARAATPQPRIVVVDHASDDESLAIIERLSRFEPGLQVVGLRRVDPLGGRNGQWTLDQRSGRHDGRCDEVLTMDLLGEHDTRPKLAAVAGWLQSRAQGRRYRAGSGDSWRRQRGGSG